MATVNGTTGNDFIHVAGDGKVPPSGFTEFDTATDGIDTIYSGGGGQDIIFAGGDDDKIRFDDDLRANDRVNGGEGYDTLEIDGQVNVTFAANTLKSIEEILLPDLGLPAGTAASQSLTMNDANVGAGALLLLNATGLSADTIFTFDGSAETDGAFAVAGGLGNDTITGSRGNDTFSMNIGGDDTVTSGGGEDYFYFGDALTAADRVTADAVLGGTVEVKGASYEDGVFLTPTTLVNVTRLVMSGNNFYSFASDDATVAAGTTLIVDGLGIGTAGSVAFDGSAETDGNFIFYSGEGADFLQGGARGDSFLLSSDDIDHPGGGNDVAHGGGGKDFFQGVREGMKIFGDNGFDTASVQARFSGTVFTFANDTINSIEKLQVSGAIFIMADGNVAAGKTLIVEGNAESFNGGAETDGHFAIIQDNGDAAWIGGALADSFDVTAGAKSVVTGGEGNDLIVAGAAFDVSDLFDGGAGKDTVSLKGDYFSGGYQHIGAAALFNVETLLLAKGFSYALITNDNNVGPGQTLTIDASKLGRLDQADIDAQAESDGRFIFLGGAGADVFQSGSGNDLITGGRGSDLMRGNGGADRFIYKSLADSTLPKPDFIVDFTRADHDKIDLKAIDANSGLAGDQAFSFIGKTAFGHHAGELRYVFSGGHTFIKGDTDGNGTADFQIDLLGTLNMHAGDFVL